MGVNQHGLIRAGPLHRPARRPAKAMKAMRMIAEIERKPIVDATDDKAAMRDPVGVRDQGKAGGFQWPTRIGRRVERSRAQYVAPIDTERQQRPAPVGRKPCFNAVRGEPKQRQPTISSNSRPLVSCTSARTKKKEIAANAA